MKRGVPPGWGAGMPKMDGGWGRSKAATENNYGYQCGYQKSVLLYYEYMVLIYMIFLKVTGGERGIRTLDTLLTYTRFPGVLFQPLRHLSVLRATQFEELNNVL